MCPRPMPMLIAGVLLTAVVSAHSSRRPLKMAQPRYVEPGEKPAHHDHHHGHAQEVPADRVELETGHVHECVHDRIMKRKRETDPNVGKVHVPYASNSQGRRAQPQAFTNMRIKYFWGGVASGSGTTKTGCAPSSGAANLNCHCEAATDSVPDFNGATQTCSTAELLSSAKQTYINGVMDQAITWLQNAMKVEPVSGNLMVSANNNAAEQPYCGSSSFNNVGVQQSMDHLNTGVADADFIIYLSAVPTSGSTVAWALTCNTDQNGRPTAGHVNWGASNIDETQATTSLTYSSYVATAVHEIMHALGFSSSYFSGNSQWFSAYCTAAGQSAGCAASSTFTERGQTVTKIITTEVLSQVRTHSNCSTLNGAEIEQEGGTGTAGSHWEKRVFGMEGMTGTGSASTSQPFSKMTLAYFKDTGHYDVDYTKADIHTWGQNKGCSFWTDKCNAATSNTPEFCFPTTNPPTSPTVTGCDYQLRGGAYCDVQTYNSAIDANFQYFTAGGQYGGSSTLLQDYCPIMQGYSNQQCWDSNDASTGVTDVQLGQARGTTSRCFSSNIMTTTLSGTLTGDSGVRCFTVSCNSGCASYTITVQRPTGGTDVLTCSAAGEATYPSGFASRWKDASTGGGAVVTCWDPAEVCGANARAMTGTDCIPSPTASPTVSPTTSPTAPPSLFPSGSPTFVPTVGQGSPSKSPATSPPSASPTASPASPTASPTASPLSPSASPVTPAPSVSPTTPPPSASPSASPTAPPQVVPTASPQPPTLFPTSSPVFTPAAVAAAVTTGNTAAVKNVLETQQFSIGGTTASVQSAAVTQAAPGAAMAVSLVLTVPLASLPSTAQGIRDALVGPIAAALSVKPSQILGISVSAAGRRIRALQSNTNVNFQICPVENGCQEDDGLAEWEIGVIAGIVGGVIFLIVLIIVIMKACQRVSTENEDPYASKDTHPEQSAGGPPPYGQSPTAGDA
eukprot:TRINITY_DN2361_c0_g1_i1.p1 TRINITY_DN2361_c0_g1~~TRINITY_DN2361_c0_g1_i1.p1  ORF type:complete len:990 (+),score=321.38 TRINITY_DN2361_c0_g1_i1:89-2971(+)